MCPVLERRSSQRLPVQVWVEETCGDSMYFHRTANLSAGGLFLDGTMPHEPGTRVRLRITFPGDEAPIEVPGEIVPPTKDKEIGMGVRFVDVPDDVRERIEAFIDDAVGFPLGR